jgi:cysteine desulfurase
MNKIYLDYAATTPVSEEIIESYYKLLKDNYANSDSIHELGTKAATYLKRAREQIANLLSCKENEVIFTSGSTESNNMAIKGVALAYKNRGNHIITTKIEHPSVIDSCKQLEEVFGFEITYLSVDKEGKINLDELKNSLRKDTILVSIMAVNNEMGSIQDIEKISQIIKENSTALYHIDATQAMCKEKLNYNVADLYNFSSHKFYGLKGSSVLIKKEKVRLIPLLSGGQQENGNRGGTVNWANHVMMAKSLRLGLEKLEDNYNYVKSLKYYLLTKLSGIDGLIVNSPKDSSPYILNVYIENKRGEVIVNALSSKGIYVSTKSACSSRSKEYSSSVFELTKDNNISKNSLRISLSHLTSRADLDVFFEELKDIIETLKG